MGKNISNLSEHLASLPRQASAVSVYSRCVCYSLDKLTIELFPATSVVSEVVNSLWSIWTTS